MVKHKNKFINRGLCRGFFYTYQKKIVFLHYNKNYIIKIMEKRTCKVYNIDGVDGVKLKIGTTDKNYTTTFYAVGKFKVKYTGNNNANEEFKQATCELQEYINASLEENDLLEDKVILQKDVSENNLIMSGYSKIEILLFLKLKKSNKIDAILPKIEPIIKNFFIKYKEMLNNHNLTI